MKKIVFDETYEGFSEAFSKVTVGMIIHALNKKYLNDAFVFTVGEVLSSENAVIYTNSPIDIIEPGLCVLPVKNTSNATTHSEGRNTLALSDCSHSEGYSTKSTGYCAHSEGNQTESTANQSHAEGFNTKATGNQSHSEGYATTASGKYSHSGGLMSTAIGDDSFAHGNEASASNAGAVAFGFETHAKGAHSFACGSKTTASGECSFCEGRETVASGVNSHAEGLSTDAKSSNSHAEGYGTEAFAAQAHAEGYNTHATGESSHAEGKLSKSSGIASHAEGNNCTASGDYSHAGGELSKAIGKKSRAFGDQCYANAECSIAEGANCSSNGYCSHAEGLFTNCTDYYAHSEGYNTVAKFCQHADGHFNDYEKTTTSDTREGANSGTAFMIGNGTSGTRSNAARIDYNGKLWCKQAYSSTGADYAELFEWTDGNPDNEDRRGYFVTVEGKKIKKAQAGDYILGIISGNPSVIGNTDMEWYGQFMRDEFGTFIKENYKETITEPVIDEEGNVTEEEREVDVEFYKVNPDYDPDAPYTFRLDRPEWDAAGMVGVLPVRDDGTCEVGKFCKCADGGIATLAAERGFDTYMVIERVTENIVSVILK